MSKAVTELKHIGTIAIGFLVFFASLIKFQQQFSVDDATAYWFARQIREGKAQADLFFSLGNLGEVFISYIGQVLFDSSPFGEQFTWSVLLGICFAILYRIIPTSRTQRALFVFSCMICVWLIDIHTVPKYILLTSMLFFYHIWFSEEKTAETKTKNVYVLLIMNAFLRLDFALIFLMSCLPLLIRRDLIVALWKNSLIPIVGIFIYLFPVAIFGPGLRIYFEDMLIARTYLDSFSRANMISVFTKEVSGVFNDVAREKMECLRENNFQECQSSTFKSTSSMIRAFRDLSSTTIVSTGSQDLISRLETLLDGPDSKYISSFSRKEILRTYEVTDSNLNAVNRLMLSDVSIQIEEIPLVYGIRFNSNKSNLRIYWEQWITRDAIIETIEDFNLEEIKFDAENRVSILKQTNLRTNSRNINELLANPAVFLAENYNFNLFLLSVSEEEKDKVFSIIWPKDYNLNVIEDLESTVGLESTTLQPESSIEIKPSTAFQSKFTSTFLQETFPGLSLQVKDKDLRAIFGTVSRESLVVNLYLLYFFWIFFFLVCAIRLRDSKLASLNYSFFIFLFFLMRTPSFSALYLGTFVVFALFTLNRLNRSEVKNYPRNLTKVVATTLYLFVMLNGVMYNLNNNFGILQKLSFRTLALQSHTMQYSPENAPRMYEIVRPRDSLFYTKLRRCVSTDSRILVLNDFNTLPYYLNKSVFGHVWWHAGVSSSQRAQETSIRLANEYMMKSKSLIVISAQQSTPWAGMVSQDRFRRYLKENFQVESLPLATEFRSYPSDSLTNVLWLSVLMPKDQKQNLNENLFSCMKIDSKK